MDSHGYSCKNGKGIVTIMNGDVQQWVEVVKNNQVIGVCSSIIRSNKKISYDNWQYKCTIRIWQFLMPIRHYTFKINAIKKTIIRKNGR